MILEIDAQRRLLAKDHRALPRILVSGLFAGQGCSGLTLSFACRGSWRLVLKGLLAEDSRDWRWMCFAGQESSKSSLHVVCLSRIQEVGAEGRLLAKDSKCWCCKPLAGCGWWKLALNLGATGRLLQVWRSEGWRCQRILEATADGRLLAEDLEVGAVLQ